MALKKLVTCPFCVDGWDITPDTGGLVYCEVCHGTSILTPDNICYCGRSCTTTQGDLDYCGNAKCLDELQGAARWNSYSSFRNF